MTNATDLAFSHTRYKENVNELPNYPSTGLTKREWYAGMEKSDPPPDFYWLMLKRFDKEKGSKRDTQGHPSKMMSADELCTVLQAWKVKCADALINELNKQEVVNG